MKLKLTAYYRVSTDKQKRSGLGLEAQMECVRRYAEANNAEIIASYTEVESGKKNNRPKLLEALAQVKRDGSTLVVAKMDRLTRNAGFMCMLCDSGVKFVACDNPGVNEMTAKILAVVAEQERKDIVARTKAALAVRKRQGKKLGAARPGAPQLTAKARLKGSKVGAAVAKKKADDAYADLFNVVLKLKDQGHSLEKIATHLNDDGKTTSTGTAWGRTQVFRLLKRAERVTK